MKGALLIQVFPHPGFGADILSRSEQTPKRTSSPSGPRGIKRKRSGALTRSTSASPSSIPARMLDPETPQTKRPKRMYEHRRSGLREVVNAPLLEPTPNPEYEIGESQQTGSSGMTGSGHTGVPTTQESADTMSGSSEGTTEDEEDEEEDFLADAFAQDAKGGGEGEEEESESDDSDSDTSEEANG